MPGYRRLEDGTVVPVIPEPYWYRGLATLFRWKPGCWPCKKVFRKVDDYRLHHIMMHSVTDEDNE